MACKCDCKLCDRLVVSQSVTFTGGVLVINLPNMDYEDGEKYCVIIGQDIPTNVTVSTQVVFTIGTGVTQFPAIGKCCKRILASALRSRHRYATRVITSTTGGSFKFETDLKTAEGLDFINQET